MITKIPPREEPAAPIPTPQTGMGKAGDVCGVLGILLGLLLSVGLGIVLCILAIVFGAVGKSKGAVVCGVIGLVIAIAGLS